METIIDSSQQNLMLYAELCQEPVNSSTAHRVCPKILVVLVRTPSSSIHWWLRTCSLYFLDRCAT